MSLLKQYRKDSAKELYNEFLEAYNQYPIPENIKRRTTPINLNKEFSCDILFVKDPMASESVVLGKDSKYYNILKYLQSKNLKLDSSIWIDCIPYCPEVKVGEDIKVRPPNTSEQAIAKQYLNALIDNMKPKMIVLFGNISLKMFKDGPSILEEHGKKFNLLGNDFFPLYSLNYLATFNGENKNAVQAELLKDIDALIDDIKEHHSELIKGEEK